VANNEISCEFIFIDDYSPQQDFLVIADLCKKDSRVKLLRLSRNFGQQAAISCGLKHARGEWIIVMDADLQDRPEEIPNFYKKAMEGYDIVFSKVENRNDSFLKKAFSSMFYRIFGYFTGSKGNHGIRNFGIYHRKVVDAFLSLDEQFRGFALLVRWLGFKSTVIEVQHDRREIGKTSYNFTKGLNLAMDSFLTFSDKPLRITIMSGFVVSLISFMAGLVFLFRALLGYTVILGWTSLILSIWFLSGFTVFCVGLIGLYVGKVFNETKKRPHYIVDYTINIDEEV
jgi:dolichol-phosphate mannosyltransferase